MSTGERPGHDPREKTQMRNWRLMLIGLFLVVAGGGLARFIQTSGGVTISDIRIEQPDGNSLSALLYVPADATEATPAPGILAVHGYINSRETQSGFAIEFARRGYVVLALDQSGHGFSEGAAFANGFGGPAALAYLRSLPYVDANNIGLEGHSMGGWTVLAAASAMPDAYRAVVLEGSSTGPGFAAKGTPEWPRNLAVVFSRYDEFAPLMWGVAKAADLSTSTKLQQVFGTSEPIQTKRVYGSVEDGTARWLATPNTTHPGDHLSTEAIGDAVEWMSMTLEGGRDIPPSSQIWIWKEIGTLIALAGGVFLLLGVFHGLLAAPWFSSAAGASIPAGDRPSAAWWAGLAVSAAIPAVTYFPTTEWGSAWAGIAWLPQNITNQMLAWALLNGALGLIAVGIRWKSGNEGAILQKLAAGVVSVGVLYLAVLLSQSLFTSDLRFWVVALKPMAPHHWPMFAAYLLPFTAFFYASQRAFHATLSLGGPAFRQYAVAIASMAGGMVVLLLWVYGALFAIGALPGTDPLWSVIAIQFAPVLAACAVISVFTWRRTGGALSGAVICGLLVTWYIVAGQATHVWSAG